jgi:hypothetical protein
MLMLLVTVSFGSPLCCSAGFAQERGQIYEVDIVHEEQEWQIEPCPMPGIDGDTWRIRNLSSDTVCVWVLLMVGDKNPFEYILAPMDSVDHPVSWADCGIQVFVGMCHAGYPVAVCERPCGPALGQWGTAALVIALTSVTIWVLLRKKARYQTRV